MAEVSYEVPTSSDTRNAAEAKVGTALTKVKEGINGKIGTVNLEAASVTEAKLGAGSVVAAKLGSESVEESKIKAAAVSATKLATGAKELFPQLTSAGSKKINWGITGNLTEAATTEVEHGLGAEPTTVLVTVLLDEAKDGKAHVRTKTSTKIKLENRCQATAKIMWVAFT